MGWTTCYNLDDLLAAAERAAPSCDVVSFDLFDTLVVRRTHDPDLVKPATARFITEKLAGRGKALAWEEVQDLRDELEQAQRRETANSFEDHEARYPDFMGQLLQKLFPGEDAAALLEEVTAYELATESAMLVPRERLVALLRELRAAGKKILVISDVYLPAEHLRTLIANAGFLDAVDGVISSADSFLAKASGKAFPLVRDQYGLDYARWLHIGDNPHSDGLKPSEVGIRALVLRDASEKHRKSVEKRYYNYSQGQPFWRGRNLQQLMLPLEAENLPRPFLFRYGFLVLAPLLCAFVQGVLEACLKEKIRRVYFFSREGWLLQKIWDILAPVLHPAAAIPEASYLYVSRMALAGPSCAQGMVQGNADIVFLPAGNRDFRDVCRVFGLTPEPFAPHLARYGLTAETVLSCTQDGFDLENRRLFNLLFRDEPFQDEVRAQTADANLALQRYLEDQGFFAQPTVALVDIGWMGTIQRYLYDAVKHRPDAPACRGYVLAATRGVDFPEEPKNTLRGLLYDRDRFDLAGSSILYARDIFEEACRAPHPTLNAYALEGEGYKLVFRGTDDATGRAEQAQDAYYGPLQEGILEGARRYAPAAAVLGHRLRDLKPWLNYLMSSRLAFPKTDEVLAIRQRHHLDDFHGTHQPTKKHRREQLQLWDRSAAALRFCPLLRLKYFVRHLRHRIKEA